MVLGFYKYLLKEFFTKSFINFKLRLKGNSIGKNCKISKDIIIQGNVQIKDNVTIGSNVKLGNNVIIGAGAKIEKVEIGENTQIEFGVVFTGCGNGKIKIGKNSYIGINNVLDWSDNICIGDFVHLAGPSTGLWTHTSVQMCLKGVPKDNKSFENRPTAQIIIEDNVYVGGNCTIYPGITIRNHSVIAPNSAVAKNVESLTLVGGVPAKKIKDLKI